MVIDCSRTPSPPDKDAVLELFEIETRGSTTGQRLSSPACNQNRKWIHGMMVVCVLLGLVKLQGTGTSPSSEFANGRSREPLTTLTSSRRNSSTFKSGRSSTSAGLAPTTQQESEHDDLLKDIFSDILNEETTNSSAVAPLWKAFEWVQNDPHFFRYPKERLRQRFGLAALYYATTNNGNSSWKHSDDWLSYKMHECHWWPGSFTTPICGAKDKNHPVGNDWHYEQLLLPENDMRGTIPPQVLKLLPSLRHIRLDRNMGLAGHLPSEIGQLTNLQQLLQQNRFTGYLPLEINHLTGLEELSLARNNFVGTVSPEIFGKLTSLQKLYLDHNSFSGTIPQAELEVAPLTRLRLDHNNFARSSGVQLRANLS